VWRERRENRWRERRENRWRERRENSAEGEEGE
jgi:hypothetical protein